ncbi:hybrid sensor histidine kinase/response regulator [Melittangium boletus]|uniref:histidine kinase n=1 Tax=Melittangium boletus DSM 14713 TaxID=1294270 RepID=A0A250IKA9_9BACT|nr:ATP-binding protein [Melittangium boletus]ATB31597.1 chemotaxis protein CheY [Melittangium boletus DSM 14713]
MTDEALAGGGEMGALIRAKDWSLTPLGPIASWPQSLRTAVSICLGSRFPYLILWGDESVQIYNDAFRPILGPAKHPQALGGRARDTWPEVWFMVGPMVEGAFHRGEASWVENQLFLFDRGDLIEEVYLTFSHSPIRDETGKVGGIFQAVSDVTRGVLGARRLSTLRALTSEARSLEEAARACLRVLGDNLSDVPFAALYLLEGGGTRASLVATSGMRSGTRLAPLSLSLSEEDAPWPFAAALERGAPLRVDGLVERFGEDVPKGPWPERPPSAWVLPLARSGQVMAAGPEAVALLVLGVSARLRLDSEYMNFFELVAGHVSTALASARAYQEERRRAEALAELDRAKTTFFSNISHEFRTPLTLILGPLEDLLASEGLAEEERGELRVIHRNAGRLLRLVNSLLDFSRLESGRARAFFEPTDLSAFTVDLASAFRSAAEKAGLRLTVDCPPLARPVLVDREMWEKIVLNLLSNAFKFTFEGDVRVSLREDEAHVLFQVEDTGTGIPAAELPHVFERFHRVQGARSRSHEGTGIGLSLVRELVLLHGGVVGVRSTEGQGTCFTVEFPLGHEHLPEQRVRHPEAPESTATGAELFVDEALRWSDGARAAMKPEDVPAPPVSPPQGRVLLADDNADMRDYVRRVLSVSFEVEAVADGQEALESALSRPFDLILTDVMMPRLGGFGLLRALREAPATRTLPIIMLSARAGEESAVEGLEAGADDYLIKPFSARELLARVRSNLELARTRRALVHQEAFAQGLQEALRARDEFLSAASHELKTPLAAFRLQLELIERNLSPEARTSVGERILLAGKHVRRLARLVETLLDVSELMNGRFELRLEETDLSRLVAEVVARMRDEFKHAECPVTFQADSPLMGRVDRHRLAQVVERLLHNAIKYGTGKPIELTLEQDERGRMNLCVIDHGMGISPEDKPRIFDRFERAVPVRRYGGLGLGLWVTRQWVEAHGGRVLVEDTPGGGATFRVELPGLASARVGVS